MSISPQDRNNAQKAFNDLPEKEKEGFYTYQKHLRHLMVLWGLDEPSQNSVQSVAEKRRILLVYKLVHMLWFSRLPEKTSEIFDVYLRDRLPTDQTPEEINKIFSTSLSELESLCKEITQPEWLSKAIKPTRISLESFPNKVS